MKSWGYAEQTFQLDRYGLVEEAYIPERWTKRKINNLVYSIPRK
jgi:hypothetical protein